MSLKQKVPANNKMMKKEIVAAMKFHGQIPVLQYRVKDRINDYTLKTSITNPYSSIRYGKTKCELIEIAKEQLQAKRLNQKTFNRAVKSVVLKEHSVSSTYRHHILCYDSNNKRVCNASIWKQHK